MRPVHNVHGSVVNCEGGWNTPKNVEQFQSAISALHQQFGMSQRYISCVYAVNNSKFRS